MICDIKILLIHITTCIIGIGTITASPMNNHLGLHLLAKLACYGYSNHYIAEYMYVCRYVCVHMYVCMYVCMHMYVRMHVCTYVCILILCTYSTALR